MTLKELLETELDGIKVEIDVTVFNEKNEFLEYTSCDTLDKRIEKFGEYLNYDVIKYYTFGLTNSHQFYQIIIIITYKNKWIKSIEHEVTNE